MKNLEFFLIGVVFVSGIIFGVLLLMGIGSLSPIDLSMEESYYNQINARGISINPNLDKENNDYSHETIHSNLHSPLDDSYMEFPVFYSLPY